MKKFLPDLIAILAFIILSFAYFFRLILKVVSCFSMTRLLESAQDKNRKSISNVPENVRAGRIRFLEVCLPIRCLRVTTRQRP